MGTTVVTRTYLEMRSTDALRAAGPPDPAPRIERVGFCPASFYRYLYGAVGRSFGWTDRLTWDDDAIGRHLGRPAITLWLMSSEAAPAGYFEFERHGDGSVEIAYFGLLPEFVGRGWGKYLLTRAVQEAWALGAGRVWLHTCTLDHPSALPNYLKRGFTPVRQETYEVELAPR